MTPKEQLVHIRSMVKGYKDRGLESDELVKAVDWLLRLVDHLTKQIFKMQEELANVKTQGGGDDSTPTDDQPGPGES